MPMARALTVGADSLRNFDYRFNFDIFVASAIILLYFIVTEIRERPRQIHDRARGAIAARLPLLALVLDLENGKAIARRLTRLGVEEVHWGMRCWVTGYHGL